VGELVRTGVGVAVRIGTGLADGDEVGTAVGTGFAAVGDGEAVGSDCPSVDTAVGVVVALPDGTGCAPVGDAVGVEADPVPVGDGLAVGEWLASLACWLAAAAAAPEHPASARPPTVPSTQPAMTRDRLSSDRTCVLHDVGSLLTLGAVDPDHGKYVRGREKLCRPGSNLPAVADV
jgi:hypothetical protein